MVGDAFYIFLVSIITGRDMRNEILNNRFRHRVPVLGTTLRHKYNL
jgi:hypothetical protein